MGGLEGVFVWVCEGGAERQALRVGCFDLGEDVVDLSGPQVVAVDDQAVGLGTVGFFGAGAAAERVVRVAVEVVYAVLVQRAQAEDGLGLQLLLSWRKQARRAREGEGREDLL